MTRHAKGQFDVQTKPDSGPDEVHHMVVGRNELRQYREMPHDPSTAAVFRN